MTQPLYPHQQAGIDFIHKNRKVLLAFSMRLGKSRTALEAVRPDQKIMIICPVVMKITWQREIEKWLGEEVSVQIMHKRTSVLDPTARAIIVPYSVVYALAKAGELPKPDYLIIDEVHFCANYEAKRTRATMHLLKASNMAVMLSGTPVVNRPADLWPIVMNLGIIRDKLFFDKHFCEGWAAPWGWDTRGAKNLDELSELLRDFMLPVGRDEVVGMPDVISPKVIELDLPTDQREKSFTRKAIKQNLAPPPWESMTDILKMSGQRKAPLAVEHIKELLMSMDKVVVWFWFRDVGREVEELLQAAGYDTAYVDGSVTKRQEEIDRFNTDPDCRVIIGQIAAMGVGVELTGAFHSVFVEAPWSPAMLWQAITRTWGPNQAQPHISTDILTIHMSIDSYVLHTILRKQEIVNTLICEETTMELKDIDTIDRAVRRLVEVCALNQNTTVRGYVTTLFHDTFTDIAQEESAGEIPEEGEEAASEEQSPPAITKDALRRVLSEAIGDHGPDKVKMLLKNVGASRLSDVEPDMYHVLVDLITGLPKGEDS